MNNDQNVERQENMNNIDERQREADEEKNIDTFFNLIKNYHEARKRRRLELAEHSGNVRKKLNGGGRSSIVVPAFKPEDFSHCRPEFKSSMTISGQRKERVKKEDDEEEEEEEVERTSFQICDVVVSDNKTVVVVDENEKVGDEVNKEKKPEEEKEKAKRSVTKNRPVFRLSLEKTIPPRAIDTVTDIALSEKRSERPIEAKEEPVNRQRFSLLSCFMGNAKTQDQNQSRRQRNTDKKKQKKQFLCLCSNKPKNVRES